MITLLIVVFVVVWTKKLKQARKDLKETETKLHYLSAQNQALEDSICKNTEQLNSLTNVLDNWSSQLEIAKRRIISEVQQNKRDEKARIIAEFEDFKNAVEIDKNRISEELRLAREKEKVLSRERLSSEKNSLIFNSRSIEEIKELYGVCSRLSNPVPLYKAIYECYVKLPYAELVANSQSKGVCGIYVITNKVDGRRYIGQSVDIAERWKQHIKRGLGCEDRTISGGKLYNAMAEFGIWNFTFEILQVCRKEELNDNEHYWIAHYNTVECGYNSRS